MPNQEMLINEVVLQELKDSSEIENTSTTKDQLYKALATKTKHGAQVKEVINDRSSTLLGYNLIRKKGFLR